MYNIKEIKKDFINCGLALNLFNDSHIDLIKEKLRNTSITEDYSLNAEALTIQNDNGSKEIIVNPSRIVNKSQMEIEELFFHEFFHAVSEINYEISKINSDYNREIYERPQGRFVPFEERVIEARERNNPYYNNGLNRLNQFPGWGLILLDEVLAQTTAQAMIEAKYNVTYESVLQKSSIYPSDYEFSSSLKYYSEYEEPATCFSKMVTRNKNLLTLSSLALKNEFLDTVFDKFSDKENTLYDIFAYMGNIAIALYQKEGHSVQEGAEKNTTPENVLLSLDELKFIANSMRLY